jgi:hypothetical protein
MFKKLGVVLLLVMCLVGFSMGEITAHPTNRGTYKTNDKDNTFPGGDIEIKFEDKSSTSYLRYLYIQYYSVYDGFKTHWFNWNADSDFYTWEDIPYYFSQKASHEAEKNESFRVWFKMSYQGYHTTSTTPAIHIKSGDRLVIKADTVPVKKGSLKHKATLNVYNNGVKVAHVES